MSENIIDRVRESLAGNWHKGYDGPDGSGCVLYHFHKIQAEQTGTWPAYTTGDHNRAWEFFYGHILAATGQEPYDYNDAPSTSEEDMLLHLKLASAAFDEQEAS